MLKNDTKKWQKVVISTEEKLCPIKRLDAGDAKKIASEMDVGTSTVSDRKKSHKKLEKWLSHQASVLEVKKCKMMKTTINDTKWTKYSFCGLLSVGQKDCLYKDLSYKKRLCTLIRKWEMTLTSKQVKDG